MNNGQSRNHWQFAIESGICQNEMFIYVIQMLNRLVIFFVENTYGKFAFCLNETHLEGHLHRRNPQFSKRTFTDAAVFHSNSLSNSKKSNFLQRKFKMILKNVKDTFSTIFIRYRIKHVQKHFEFPMK